jgi:hypothetical protein
MVTTNVCLSQPVLQKGSTGTEVQRLQEQLNFYFGARKQLAVDGVLWGTHRTGCQNCSISLLLSAGWRCGSQHLASVVQPGSDRKAPTASRQHQRISRTGSASAARCQAVFRGDRQRVWSAHRTSRNENTSDGESASNGQHRPGNMVCLS